MKKSLWLLPAFLSMCFLLFTVWVMVQEGPLGFMADHMRTRWGAQIGIDLVNSVLLALLFVIPAARRYHIRLLPWVVLSLLTGSIGLLALAARLLHASATRDAGVAAERA